MKLILARSLDGVLAKGPTDDMTWTGQDDKTIFRLLTQVHPSVCAAGGQTFDQMPRLKGRKLVRLSRNDPSGLSMTLDRFAHVHPDGWLLGGPTVALEALDQGLVDQVFMCVAPVQLGGHPYEADWVYDNITPQLVNGPQWHVAQRIRFGTTFVECWTNGERPQP